MPPLLDTSVESVVYVKPVTESAYLIPLKLKACASLAPRLNQLLCIPQAPFLRFVPGEEYFPFPTLAPLLKLYAKGINQRWGGSMRRCVPSVQGMGCTPQVVGILAHLPLPLPHVNQPPHVVTLLLGPQSSAQLGQRGLAQTHPARNAGVHWGPCLHPAPSPRLRSTSQGTHFCKILGIPRFQDTEKSEPQTHPRRAVEATPPSGPRLPWQRGLPPGPGTHLRLRKRTEDASTRRLHFHPTQNAPRCLRRDVTMDVSSRDLSVLYKQRTPPKGGFLSEARDPE